MFHEYRNLIVGVWAVRARREDKAKSYNDGEDTHNQIRCGKAAFSVAENHAIQGAQLDDLGSRGI